MGGDRRQFLNNEAHFFMAKGVKNKRLLTGRAPAVSIDPRGSVQCDRSRELPLPQQLLLLKNQPLRPAA
jgi:hypothetical protein